MKYQNFVPMREIKRLRFLILVSLGLLLFSQGNISPSVAAGPEAHLKGEFGPLHNWPIIPIHMALLPDGRVFAFGTKMGKLKYTIWS